MLITLSCSLHIVHMYIISLCSINVYKYYVLIFKKIWKNESLTWWSTFKGPYDFTRSSGRWALKQFPVLLHDGRQNSYKNKSRSDCLLWYDSQHIKYVKACWTWVQQGIGLGDKGLLSNTNKNRWSELQIEAIGDVEWDDSQERCTNNHLPLIWTSNYTPNYIHKN